MKEFVKKKYRKGIFVIVIVRTCMKAKLIGRTTNQFAMLRKLCQARIIFLSTNQNQTCIKWSIQQIVFSQVCDMKKKIS